MDGCVGINDNESSWNFPELISLQAKGIRLMKSSSWCYHLQSCKHLIKVQLGESLIEHDLVNCLLNLPSSFDSDSVIDSVIDSGCTMTEAHVKSDTCLFEDLDLSWSEMPGCLAIALACASGKALKCLNLRCVGLDRVHAVTEDNDETTISRQTLIHLVELTHSLLEEEDNMVLSLLGSHCPNLIELNLSRCGEKICGLLAVRDLVESIGHCLLKLDLNWTNVSDHGLIEIVTQCISLQWLGLQGCKALSVHTGALLKNHTQFSCFNLFLCLLPSTYSSLLIPYSVFLLLINQYQSISLFVYSGHLVKSTILALG